MHRFLSIAVVLGFSLDVAEAEVIGQATVTVGQTPIVSDDGIIAWAKRGEVLQVTRIEGKYRYWVMDGKGWVSRAHIRFTPVSSKPPVEPKDTGPKGPNVVEVAGNRFLKCEDHPFWKWRHVMIRSRKPLVFGERKKFKTVPHALDVTVAQDGSAFFLAGDSFEIAVFRSIDGGVTFWELPKAYWPVATSRDGKVVYGLSGPKLFRSDDEGKTWSQVCEDMQLPNAVNRPKDEYEAILFAGKTATLMTDPFDSDRVFLGVRLPVVSTGRRTSIRLLSTELEHNGIVGESTADQWRVSVDGGKTWHGWSYGGTHASEMTRSGEVAPLRERSEQRTRHLLDGALWFSPTARDLMWWVNAMPVTSGDFSGKGFAVGVMRSVDAGRTWRQIGPRRADLDMPEKQTSSFAPIPCIRPGVHNGRPVLYSFVDYAPGEDQPRRFEFLRHDGTRWSRKELFRLSDIESPKPTGLLVDKTGTRIFVPLEETESGGRITRSDGLTSIGHIGGVLVSINSGESWRLFKPGVRGRTTLVGPDRRNILYSRSGYASHLPSDEDVKPPEPTPEGEYVLAATYKLCVQVFAVDSGGKIHVLVGDRSPFPSPFHHQRLSAEGPPVWTSEPIKTRGPGGKIGKPRGLAVDTKGNYYLLDESRIQKRSADGTLLKEIGSRGSSPGQFSTSTAIAIDAEDNLYVCDLGTKCIQKLSTEGRLLARWTSEDAGDERFFWINGVAVDGKGNVYASTGGNKDPKIRKLGPDGRQIAAWGSKGDAPGELHLPEKLAVDSAGCVYVLDRTTGIQKFDADGKFVKAWGAPSDDVKIDYTGDIAVAPDGTVLVASKFRGTIQVFRPTK